MRSFKGVAARFAAILLLSVVLATTAQARKHVFTGPVQFTATGGELLVTLQAGETEAHLSCTGIQTQQEEVKAEIRPPMTAGFFIEKCVSSPPERRVKRSSE